MKLRTSEMLCDKLSRELSWRKKELTDLKYIIESGYLKETRKAVLGRCGISILYAHWEGFVKISARYFFEFLSMQRLTNAELTDNFLSIMLKNKIGQDIKTKKASRINWITEFFIYKQNERSMIPYRKAVDTESNLSSKVFKEIIWCLGLDYSPYETSEKMIDAKLLGRRNHIAHGEELHVELNEYINLHDRIISLMNIFRNQLENSAVTKSYIRS